MKNRGFTLIELLIVITLLGILATAVLSAINPIEQINRSKDTAKESDCEQLINATDRYYASNGYYPWMVDGNSAKAQDWQAVDATWVDVGGTASVLEKLSSGGTAEIKASFVTRIEALTPTLQVYNHGDQGDSTYVCFKPDSANFRDKAWQRCTGKPAYGSLPGDYPGDACPATDCTNATSAKDATACYYCLP